MGLVDHPIQEPLGQHRVGEEGVPVLGTAVRGHYQGAGAATLVDELLDILRLLEAELLHGEGIQQQEIGTDILA